VKIAGASVVALVIVGGGARKYSSECRDSLAERPRTITTDSPCSHWRRSEVVISVQAGLKLHATMNSVTSWIFSAKQSLPKSVMQFASSDEQPALAIASRQFNFPARIRSDSSRRAHPSCEVESHAAPMAASVLLRLRNVLTDMNRQVRLLYSNLRSNPPASGNRARALDVR